MSVKRRRGRGGREPLGVRTKRKTSVKNSFVSDFPLSLRSEAVIRTSLNYSRRMKWFVYIVCFHLIILYIALRYLGQEDFKRIIIKQKQIADVDCLPRADSHLMSSKSDFHCIPNSKRALSRPILLSSSRGNRVDEYVVQTLMNNVRFLGTFVEFGCSDGVTDSNTWALEQLGWIGLCIEANPITLEKARKVRKNVVQALIGDVGEYHFVIMSGRCKQLSGIKEFYSREFLDLYADCKRNGLVVSEEKVASIPLEHILDQYGLKSVTYLSIDCEGCEFHFIKSFNFTEYDVQIFSYENNSSARPHLTDIDRILARHRFDLKWQAGDRLFTRKLPIRKAK